MAKIVVFHLGMTKRKLVFDNRLLAHVDKLAYVDGSPQAVLRYEPSFDGNSATPPPPNDCKPLSVCANAHSMGSNLRGHPGLGKFYEKLGVKDEIGSC